MSMQIAIEKVDNLNHKMRITLEASEVDTKVNEKLLSYSKSANIKGFRKGKVPVKVVKQMYGPSVRHDVVQKLMQERFQDAVKKEEAVPVGLKSWDIEKDEEGNPFEYLVSYEVFPEVKAVEFKKTKINQYIAELSESDVDEALERLREHHADWEVKDGAAEKEDKILATYVITKDGKEVKNQSTPETILIKSGLSTEEEKKAIIGAKAGDTVTAKRKEAKEEISYHVESVSKPNLPALDDAFAKKLEIKDGTVQTLRAEIKKNLQKTLKQKMQQLERHQVIKILLEKNPYDLPETPVKEEAKHIAEGMMRQYMPDFDASKMGGLDLPVDMFMDQALKNIHTSLLFRTIVELNKFEVTDSELDVFVKEYAEDYESPEEYVAWCYKDKKVLEKMKNTCLEDRIFNHLLELAKVTEKKVTFEELKKIEEEIKKQD
jgi:trigger factor